MPEIKSSIREQLPDHIVENYDTFTSFLEAYYEWLESGNNPYGFSKDFKKNFDLETSIDAFVSQFKREYLAQFPEAIVTDKRKLIQYIKDFYSSKGTEKALKFLFRVLFDEPVSVFYPGEDLLRLSDGKWVDNEVVLYTTQINDLTNTIFTSIKQERLVDGEYRIGEGAVRDLKILDLGGYKTAKIIISDVVGYFEPFYPVLIGAEKVEYVYPIVSALSVTSAGTDYAVGEKVQVIDDNADEYNNIITRNVTSTGRLDFQVTTSFLESDIEVRINNVLQSSNDFVWDGRFLNLDEGTFTEGDEVELKLPTYQGEIFISQIGANGELEDVEFQENPVGITQPVTMEVLTNAGVGATFGTTQSGAVIIDGYYSNSDGWLSSDKVIQDSDYYQDFSYVIKTGLPLEIYADVVKAVAHPAGMKFFGEIFSIEELQFGFQTFDDLFRVLLPPIYSSYVSGNESFVITEVAGYHVGITQRHRSILHGTHQDGSTPVGTIADWSLEEINNDPNGLSINRRYTPFMGEYDASVEASYPAAPASGSQMYRISGDGTLDGNPHVTGEYIRYNTDTIQWDLVAANERERIRVSVGTADVEVSLNYHGSNIDEIEEAVRKANAMANYYGFDGLRANDQSYIDSLIDAY